MTERVLIDNDVVLKTACYQLGEETISATTVDGVPPAMLGVGRFVIRGRLTRSTDIADRARAGTAFAAMLETIALVEPDDAELAAAADLEAEANRRDLELDGGESQLLAILANRGCSLLVTGDKRAVAAMAVVATAQAAARVACLEQLIAHIVGVAGSAALRPRVCAEPHVDRAITSCFGCSMASAPADADILDGLASYVGHLDRAAPGMLAPGHGLASLAG